MAAFHKRQGPAGTGPTSHFEIRHASNHSALRPADRLLPLLRNVRSTGRDSWRADCPNGHSHARSSLAISAAPDGRLLLHCFACRDVPGILGALGLELADLFPERIEDPSPEARQRARDAFKQSGWQAALGVLAREATVCLIAASAIRGGELLATEDLARLALAEARIQSAREVLCGRT